MHTASPVLTPTTSDIPGRFRSGDSARLQQLRELAVTHPVQARTDAWTWLRELQAPSEHDRLHGLFAEGTAPEQLDGDCEGIVMNLYGSLWLEGLDRLVRLGQWLGRIGWTGKSFNAANGTGYNRLTASSRIPALLAMPGYRFRKIAHELIGFDFYHSVETSPVAPFGKVRSIRYDSPEHGNPLVLPRTRDELVELLPGIYLGRALLRDGQGWKVVGYFGLRYPRGGN